MSALLDALLAANKKDEESNPWKAGGLGLAKFDPSGYDLSTGQSILINALKGLGSGIAYGYGEGQIEKAGQDRAQKVVDILKLGDTSKIVEALKGDRELAPAAAGFAIEELDRGRDQQKVIDKALADKGYVRTNDGMTRVFDPADEEARIAGKKKEAELRAEVDSYGFNPRKEDEVNKLRDDFSANPDVKSFAAAKKAATALSQALADNSSVADQELVRYSILMIEPGMAVREGEQNAVAASQSIPDEYKGALSKALSGETSLSPQVREGIKRLAERAYASHKQNYDSALSFYQTEAGRKGIEPERISYLGDAPEFGGLTGSGQLTPNPGESKEQFIARMMAGG